ncbi:hypothetical protein DFH06DRAFT_1225569 [Mycena polygramma]|nr:hypothetical protein DFH06DRAFT_1225569 [Mycena polygramma]
MWTVKCNHPWAALGSFCLFLKHVFAPIQTPSQLITYRTYGLGERRCGRAPDWFRDTPTPIGLDRLLLPETRLLRRCTRSHRSKRTPIWRQSSVLCGR